MAPRRRITWRTLTVGLAAIIALAAAGLLVLMFARVGALHGDRYHLYMLTDDASRVIQGTEVWLEGQKVGLVSAVRLRPVSVDTMHRVAIELEVLREYQPDIRADSRPQVRHAGSPIGAPVIMLSEGTPAARVLADGDSILAIPGTSSQELVAQLAAASQQMPHLVANVHAIVHDMNRTARKMDALPSARTAGLGALLRRASKRISTLSRRARPMRAASGRSPASDRRSAGLSERAARLAAHADSLATAAVSGRGTVARMGRDTALGTTLADAHRRVVLIGSLLAESRGSAGRFLHDSAVVHQLHGDGQRHEGQHEERDH